eukprot:1740664-Rhodomonas_salina.2
MEPEIRFWGVGERGGEHCQCSPGRASTFNLKKPCTFIPSCFTQPPRRTVATHSLHTHSSIPHYAHGTTRSRPVFRREKHTYSVAPRSGKSTAFPSQSFGSRSFGSGPLSRNFAGQLVPCADTEAPRRPVPSGATGVGRLRSRASFQPEGSDSVCSHAQPPFQGWAGPSTVGGVPRLWLPGTSSTPCKRETEPGKAETPSRSGQTRQQRLAGQGKNGKRRFIARGCTGNSLADDWPWGVKPSDRWGSGYGPGVENQLPCHGTGADTATSPPWR